MTPRKLAWMMASPATLLALALTVQVLGRLAAFCGPHKVDSYVYAVAAYRLWQPGATIESLIPDKPPGQAIITGWVYRVWPGPPSRLALLPVEFAFMLAGYVVFYRLARAMSDARWGAAATLFVVIGHNYYSALDTTTDGFNLNECYLILPVCVAVSIHLMTADWRRRCLLEGLALGCALAIKQSMIGLAVVMILHELVEALTAARRREFWRRPVFFLCGLLVPWLLLAAFLYSKGWLAAHAHDLLTLSGRHVAATSFGLPKWWKVVPVLPEIWWLILGSAGCLSAWFALKCPVPGRAQPEAAWTGHAREGRGGAFLMSFLIAWTCVETAVLLSLTIPAAHYCQQLLAPLTLLSLCLVRRATSTAESATGTESARLRRWVGVSTGLLAALSIMPLMSEVPKRIALFSRQEEAAVFDWWLANWSPGEAADHLRTPDDGRP